MTLTRLLACLLDQLDLLDVVAGGLAVEHHTLADDLHQLGLRLIGDLATGLGGLAARFAR